VVETERAKERVRESRENWDDRWRFSTPRPSSTTWAASTPLSSTSTLCVYEVIDGKLGSGSTDVRDVRQDFFGGVQALDLTENIALEAARLQDQAMSDGVRLSTPDTLIAATARSTADELVVVDSDFETDVLESYLTVTNLRK